MVNKITQQHVQQQVAITHSYIHKRHYTRVQRVHNLQIPTYSHTHAHNTHTHTHTPTKLELVPH